MSASILIIDDEQDFNELTKTMLEFHNFNVTALSDPLQVKDKIAAQHFDVIVTDLMMPGIDGFQVIELVREDSSHNQTPIVVLTAKTLTDEERKFLLQNNAYIMMKPFEPQGLIQKVQTLLGQTESTMNE